MARLIEIIQEEAPQGYIPTITSGCDFVEGRKGNSLHPYGLAIDLRVRDFPGTDTSNATPLKEWVQRIRKRLGRDYDIVPKLIINPGSSIGGHIHCEYDPKRK